METMNMTEKLGSNGNQANKREGDATKKIEKVTSSVPSSMWLILGGAAMLGSITLKVMGRDKTANFVGQWVPTILLLGIYNKIVKVMGSERGDSRTR